MNPTKADDPLFPSNQDTTNIGISIREMYAAVALHGLLQRQDTLVLNPKQIASVVAEIVDNLINQLNDRKEDEDTEHKQDDSAEAQPPGLRTTG